MAIPTKEQFDEVIDAFANYSVAELQIEADRTPLNKESLFALLKKREEILNSKKAQIDKCVALNWFHKQEKAKEAIERFSRHIFKRGPKIYINAQLGEDAFKREIEAYVEILLSRINKDMTVEELKQKNQGNPYFEDMICRHGSVEKYLEYCNSEYRKTQDVRTDLSILIQEQFGKWHHGIFTALRDYYHTNRYRILYSERQNKKKQLDAAIEGLNALETISSHLIQPPIKFTEYLKSIRSRIEKEIAAEVVSIYPIRRIGDKPGDTARERTLIYDLYLNNIKNGMKRNTVIICSLMELEGIKNPIEQRNIDIMIAGWESARKNYRKKIREFSQTTIM